MCHPDPVPDIVHEVNHLPPNPTQFTSACKLCIFSRTVVFFANMRRIWSSNDRKAAVRRECWGILNKDIQSTHHRKPQNHRDPEDSIVENPPSPYQLRPLHRDNRQLRHHRDEAVTP